MIGFSAGRNQTIARCCLWLALLAGYALPALGQTGNPNGFFLPLPDSPAPGNTPETTSTPANTPSNPPAQSPTGTTEQPQLQDSLEAFQNEVKAIEQDPGLDQANKEQLLQVYRNAIDALQKTEAYKALITRNRSALEKVPEDAEKVTSELKNLPEQFPLSVSKASALEDIEQALSSAEAQLREFELALIKAEQEVSQRTLKRKQDVELQATYSERLQKIQQKVTAPPVPDTPRLEKALAKLYQLQLTMMESEAIAVKEELNLFDAQKNAKLLTSRVELETLRVGLQRKKVETLQQMLADKKLKENMRALKELKEESDTSLPVLQSFINELEELTTRMNTLVDLTEKAQTRQREVQTQLDEVTSDMSDKQEQAATEAGSSEVFALSLLRQLYELPNLDEHIAAVHARNRLMSETTFQQIELRSDAKELINVDLAVEEKLNEIKEDAGSESLGIFEQNLKSKIKELIQRKKETLDSLLTAYSDLLDSLTTVNATEQSLVENVQEYRDFIRKRIFWIRSDKMLSLSDIRHILSGESYPFSMDDILRIPSEYMADVQTHFLLHALAASILVLLILLRVQAARELSVIADDARKTNAAAILPTLRATLLTIVIAAPGPMLVWFLGWRLGEIDIENPFREAMAESLKLIGLCYAGIEFFRQVCRRHGLADAHFNGPHILATRTRSELLIMTMTLLPLSFLVTLLNHLSTDLDRLALERIFFSAEMLIAALFAHRFLNPNGPLMREIFLQKNTAAISRTRWVWYPVATIFPVVLAAMAWAGYYYTASQLAWRLTLTLLHICAVLVIWGLALRWYRMAQRWFRIYIMRERRRQNTEETQTLEGQRLKLETESRAAEEDREKQTLRLINFVTLVPLFVGLFYIWIDVLPAVSYLEEIELWHTTVQRYVEDSNGDSALQTVREAITPLNLFLAIFAAVLTVSLTRNLPGMVDFAILQRVGFDASLRYAATTVIGYVVTFVGLTYAFGVLGFRWEQIQWLAAALTFGLSFGLQEIFANFVSGLIILFERPVRIGDIVTIEGVTGVVSKIRIRASTITDWDRKEYLVPNKELVTGRLLNWTLSDTLNRIVIPVGVAYGTDTDRVREVLFEIAKKEPEILSEPATLVTFEGFGDSTLNFVLRCYLGKMENRLETIHRLHTNIHRTFLNEGIEIAFPQRDLHIRSMPPGWDTAAGKGSSSSSNSDNGTSAASSQKND
ncbi:mechanosensitive ion channel domain-containing protein [Rubinisphaera margarita]|uniref:mechanosensitive ion channel domain-containing protein n=1 Tax=Rubinisphaera margarita TaxID=2909586 RepID=UPI001EE9508B|nr:mechanosensitive ion channel domain-containing protein [Rubinisphaera margarita]MCG6156887.1 mechanosensitive ion channel [Rubinisphaera margarita]